MLAQLMACGGGSEVTDRPPVITLNGDRSITLFQGRSYEELGATAVDDQDGIVDVTISGTVDSLTLGLYTITYTATDSLNNSSTQTRSITVEEAEPFRVSDNDPRLKIFRSFINPQFISRDGGFVTVKAALLRELEQPVIFSNGNEYENAMMRPKLISFSISDADGNVVGSNNAFEEKTIILNNTEILTPNTEYRVSVSFQWEINIDSVWIPFSTDTGIYESTENLTFRSLTNNFDSQVINEENIRVSYPLPRQMNFYKGISNNGYLSFKYPIDVLFGNGGSNSENYVFVISGLDGVEHFSADLTIDLTTASIHFPLSSSLENSTIYEFSINERANLDNKIYSSHFRTSMFNTFTEKMEGFEFVTRAILLNDNSHGPIYTLQIYFNTPELFDSYELSHQDVLIGENTTIGSQEMLGLISFEADLNHPYYNDYLEPLIYEPFTALPFFPDYEWREETSFSIPANEVVSVEQAIEPMLLTQEMINLNDIGEFSGRIIMHNNLEELHYLDYKKIQALASTQFLVGDSTERLVDILETPFPVTKMGGYEVQMNYHLPAQSDAINSYLLEFNNPFDW